MADAIATNRRPALVTQAHGRAEAAVAMLQPGGAVCALTKGQYSLIDVVLAVLAKTGAADVWVSTWSVSIRDAESAAALLRDGRIRSFRLYTDRSLASVKPLYAAALLRLYGPDAVKASNIHAKIAVIRNDSWDVCIRSSMNLNRNPRFEQWDADDSPGMADMFCGWFRELDAKAPQLAGVDQGDANRKFERTRLSDDEIRSAVAEIVQDPDAKVSPGWAGKTPWGAR